MDLTDDEVKVRENTPRERNRPIRFGGSILGNRAHICAFFNNPDDANCPAYIREWIELVG